MAKRRLAALAVASVLLLALVLYGFGAFSAPPSSSITTTVATTSYAAPALSVISSAGSYTPPGYSSGQPKELDANETGLVSAGDVTFSSPSGAFANMTIYVFDSPASAQRYIDSVISNAKGLADYSDTTSTLSGYDHYGVCYGYAEGDPAGGEYVANGVCTKGNVYIQIHLAATTSLPSAEGDLAGFVGAAYQGLG